MLTASKIKQFHRDGCVTTGPVLDAAQLQLLADELDRIIAIGPDGFDHTDAKPVMFSALGGNLENPVWQIVNIWCASPLFKELIANPMIAKAISQLTGMDRLQIWHDQIQYKPARHGGTNWWHQDAPLWPIIKPMTPVSAWIPFDDADEDNGCMWMVPGSHRWGNCMQYLGDAEHHDFFNLKPGFTPPADAPIQDIKPIPWPVKKGEVSFHHSLTWHGSPDNKSDRPRRAIAIHYMTSEAVFVASGEHVMKKFVNLQDGQPMSEAGEMFPMVYDQHETVTVS